MIKKAAGMKKELLLISFLVIVYASVFIYFEGLRFGVRFDELSFWPASLYFSHNFPPGIESLTHYNNVDAAYYQTPMAFIMFGALERAFNAGIFAGRMLNLAFSLIILVIVAFRGWKVEAKSMPAMLCILLFPYFIFTSVHLYTDILAAFFGLLGLVLHLRNRPVPSTLFFVLAISTRQTMIAFPFAIFLYEMLKSRKGRDKWMPPLIACSSMLFWVAVFGGFSPPPAGGGSAPVLLPVHPQFGLYMLSCIGAYFVIPEFILYRRFRGARMLPVRTLAAAVVPLLILFAVFPPLGNPDYVTTKSMGVLDSSLRLLMSDALRLSVLLCLAAITVLRFRKPCLSSLFVASSVIVTCFAYMAWDKYILPLLVILWYMKSRGILNGDCIKRKMWCPKAASRLMSNMFKKVAR